LTDNIKDNEFKVERFVEKPNLENAKKFLEDGNYLWNSGMFIWDIESVLEAVKSLMPDTYNKVIEAFNNIRDKEKLHLAKGIFSKIEKIIMLGCLVCAISMMGMASSRMGLICTLLSVIFVLYKLNSKNPKKLLGAAVLFVIGIFVVSSLFGDKFRFMMAKNANQIESADVSSRDATWPFRIIEFKESPVYGVGFARIKYGLGADIAEELGGTIESGSGWLSVLSQTGLLGAVCILIIVLPNIVYLFRHRSNSYCAAWYSGMCVMFVMQPISEGYITTVGAVLCCLFWLNYSVIDSFRKGVLREEDLDLSVYKQSKWFDRRLLKLGKTKNKK